MILYHNAENIMLEGKIYKAEEIVKEALSKAKRNDKALKTIDIARQKGVCCHNSNLFSFTNAIKKYDTSHLFIAVS